LKLLLRSNLVLGLWLMVSPFVLALLNHQVFRLLWEDLLLGLAIATFSFWRLMSRRSAALADFLVMALGLTTLLNPINVKIAAWNNLGVGFAVLVLAVYQDWKDSESSRRHDGHHGAAENF
jgi:hypothetical protein